VKLVASALLTVLFAISPRPPLQTPNESTARALFLNFVTGRFDAATRDFNDELYIALNPDVTDIDPRQHYLLFGIGEGRRYK